MHWAEVQKWCSHVVEVELLEKKKICSILHCLKRLSPSARSDARRDRRRRTVSDSSVSARVPSVLADGFFFFFLSCQPVTLPPIQALWIISSSPPDHNSVGGNVQSPAFLTAQELVRTCDLANLWNVMSGCSRSTSHTAKSEYVLFHTYLFNFCTRAKILQRWLSWWQERIS